MYYNILVVCLGNICRSSTAEWTMQKRLLDYRINSTGIKALVSRDIDLQAIKTALRHGVIVAGYIARQLTAQMREQADLALVTEPSQVDMVADIHPPARSKTMLFTQWLPRKTTPDPYKQSSEMLEAVFEQLNAAANTWKTKLSGKAQPV